MILGHAAWGEDALRDAAETTGASPGKISNYLVVATGYPPFRRRNTLTFSHHLEVARLPEAEADELLDRAASESWTFRRTREAAREASLEGKLARLRRESAELKRALRAARSDARNVADQVREQLRAERQVVREAARRAAAAVEQIAASDVVAGLHGNARRGLARDVRRSAGGLAADVNVFLARIEAAAAVIEEPGG